jgi:hypothetical protein
MGYRSAQGLTTRGKSYAAMCKIDRPKSHPEPKGPGFFVGCARSCISRAAPLSGVERKRQRERSQWPDMTPG